ncbi:unnamed protein product [Lathyrus sativus]|nr:unnamed protein product [Lathyrus sativus]
MIPTKLSIPSNVLESTYNYVHQSGASSNNYSTNIRLNHMSAAYSSSDENFDYGSGHSLGNSSESDDEALEATLDSHLQEYYDIGDPV